jgi:DNA (cytosine-5)-methyltransferase 1
MEMLEEFKQVVIQAQPVWWLAENVPGVSNINIAGYSW